MGKRRSEKRREKITWWETAVRREIFSQGPIKNFPPGGRKGEVKIRKEASWLGLVSSNNRTIICLPEEGSGGEREGAS